MITTEWLYHGVKGGLNNGTNNHTKPRAYSNKRSSNDTFVYDKEEEIKW